MGYQPRPATTNLHSPTAIGDVTPNTVGATAISCVSLSTNTGASISDKLFIAGMGYISYGGADGFVLITPPSGNKEFLLLGGTSSSFPMIGRNNSTTVQIRLADDSDFAPIKVSKLAISAIPTSASGLSSGDVYSNAGILTIVP